jgi:hypothetical protein
VAKLIFPCIVCHMKCKLFVEERIEDFLCSNFSGLDFVFSIFPGELSLTQELKEPVVSRELCRLSKENSFILFFHFVAVVDDKKYLSVMVVDNGRILGISDSVTTKEYCVSQRQRIYMTSKLKTGIIVDEDIFHTDSVGCLYQNKADAIVFMTAKHFSDKFFKAFCSHKFFHDIPIIAAFANKICFFNSSFHLGDKGQKYDYKILPAKQPKIQKIKLKSPSFEY